MIKNRLKSKTYWLGIITMILAYTQTNAALLDGVLKEYSGLLIFVIGLLMLIIREFTDKPLSEK